MARRLIEKVIWVKIAEISTLETEKTATNSVYKGRGVRYDILLEDEAGTRIDVEMQAQGMDDELMAKRCRYYFEMLDFKRLAVRQSFSVLGDSYVIFLCDFPIFDGLCKKYEIGSFCRRNKEIELKDGIYRIFLSSKGGDGDEDGYLGEDISAFLDYMNGAGADPQNEFVKEIDEEVQKIKGDSGKQEEYMDYIRVFDEAKDEGRDEGRKEGRAEGREEGRKEGRAEGRKEGREEGRAEERKNFILKMLKKAKPLGEIVDLSESSVEKIKEVAKENGIKYVF